MISAQEQVRQIKHGVADLINEQDLVSGGRVTLLPVGSPIRAVKPPITITT